MTCYESVENGSIFVDCEEIKDSCLNCKYHEEFQEYRYGGYVHGCHKTGMLLHKTDGCESHVKL